MTIDVRWIGRGFDPKGQSNPDYPDGADIDLTNGAPRACQAALPYPAKRVGYYLVSCDVFGFRGIVTTAGRRDDPRSVSLPAKYRGNRDGRLDGH
jgi:hypothetical protein